ncbi:G protein-coupled receptor 161-like [Tachypleus tridentatus]|uniref:G protein-coupled receptor 161-like n=1 Tax=Tachypleus tridentatus TaxID=6853 RepID=UPI003FD250DB
MANNSENDVREDDDDSFLPYALKEEILLEFYTVALFIVLVTSLISNGLVFLIFYKKPLLRTTSNYFVLNLSLTHFLQVIFVLPFTLLTLIYRDWLFGDLWCHMSETLSLCLNVETVFSLLLIATDRNSAVNSPLQYKTTTTKKRICFLIASTWFLAMLVSFPPFLGLTPIKYEYSWHSCVSLATQTGYTTMFYSSALTLLGFILPFFYTIWIYCTLFKAAQANNARTPKNSLGTVTSYLKIPVESPLKMSNTSFYKMRPCHRCSSSSQVSLFGKEWKAVRTVLLVVLSFSGCWGPYFFVVCLNSYIRQDAWMPNYLPLLVIFLSYSSCVIDPYIYVFRNQTLQRHIRKLFLSRASNDIPVSGKKIDYISRASRLRLKTENNGLKKLIRQSLPVRLTNKRNYLPNSDSQYRPVQEQKCVCCVIPEAGTQGAFTCNLQQYISYQPQTHYTNSTACKEVAIERAERSVIFYLSGAPLVTSSWRH